MASVEGATPGGIAARKPHMSAGGLANISFGFFGIQIGFVLQNSNMSRIFQTLGASMDDLPALWVAAPLTGLIVQPIIGHLSDKTWNRFGRRRPYFMTGALLAAISLFLMPLAPRFLKTLRLPNQRMAGLLKLSRTRARFLSPRPLRTEFRFRKMGSTSSLPTSKWTASHCRTPRLMGK